MKRILWSLMVAVLAIISSLPAIAQPSKISNNPWEFSVEPVLKSSSEVRQIIPKIYQTAKVDLSALKSILNQAPKRFSEAATTNPVLLTLPMADGGYAQFEIQEASIMHPELAAKFPEIQSYAGHGIDDPTASIRFDLTPAGFHAMIRSGNHSTIYIDPYATNNTEDYIVYFRKDFQEIVPEEKVCHFDEFNPKADKIDYFHNGALKMAGDCDLRTFRLALACTGEYASFHGGTVAGVMAAFNTTMVRVNGIFERDAGLTMELVPNNDELIFLNANTDPYTNNNGGTMLGQNQTTCDNVIGSANYDIGHVFSTGGGGVAYLQSPCNNNLKAGGVTGQGSPVGDPFDVDYVAHEMGHQYGANHTQNNSCNRNSSTAMEPGSASTIMGYAGICSPNVQNNSDDHFHGISLQEMGNFLTGNNSNCAAQTTTGNNPPTVNGGSNYTIPGGTKFMLTATGSDPDGNGSLTYCWEQFDNEVGSMPPSGTNSVGPMFRSISPTADPIRYFPNITDIVNNVSPTWEVLPTVGRTMDFRVSVRDNNQGAGCTAEDDVTVTVDGNTGPFLVTVPNTNVTWSAGTSETVTWDVAGTTGSPVNASNVDILLSTDGGFTYPITIMTNVPNDGSQVVTVPNNPTTTARIMVRGSNNIFFDISNQNFTIDGAVDDFFLAVTPPDQTVCQPQSTTYNVAITATGTFSGNVSLSASGLPAGATANFSPSSINTSGNSTLTIGNTAAVAPGTYNFTVSASGSTGTKTEQVTITVAAGAPSTISLVSPSNGATGVSGTPTLTWNAAAGATSYDVQVSTSPNFSPLAASASVNGTSYTVSPALQGNTTYFWRVRGTSSCGTGNFSSAFSFTTANETCNTFVSQDVPVNISSNGTPTITSTLNITDAGTITDINVTNLQIDHTYTQDLLIFLTSPQGTTINLLNQICGSLNNIDLNLDDEANTAYSDIPCPATGGGNYQPNGSLADFDGEDLNGTWTLTVEDNANQDGGSLNSWELGICYEPISTDPLVVTASATDVSCNGDQNGTASATASGGTGNYSYSWSNGASGANIGNLAPGTYSVTVNDGNETASTSVVVGEPNAISLSVTGNDLNCNGDNSGTASANATNGNYSYAWSNGASGANIGNLAVGTYTVTATNQANQCTATGSVTIAQPSAIDLEVSSTDAGCNGNDGTATASVAGGTGNVTYNWSNGQSGATITGLTPGTYSVTATDGNQCTDVSSVTVGQTGSNLSVTATATNSNCAADNGTATASASGGVGDIIYDWSNGDSGSNIGNLAPGTYTVTATDANGCTGTASVQVNQIGSNMQVSVTSTDASCGAADGTATATAFNGTGNISYSWDNGQEGQTIGGLSPGTYFVTATDVNGCTASGSTTVGESGSSVQVSATSTDAICLTNNGTATASANGGSGNYSYDWNNGQQGQTISNLAPGVYSVTATDSNGCTGETTVQVGQNNPIIQISTSTTDATCSSNNGSSTASANGGSGSYSYEWSNGQTGATIENLAAGTYTVTATDSNGCTGEDTIVVGQTGSNVQVTTSSTPSNCSANNGTASASANGGSGNYSYEWDNGQIGATIQNLAPGTYTVTATDSNGCTGEASVQVGQTGSNIQVTTSSTDATCSANNGTASASANGGSGNYSYEWSNGQQGQTISNLASGVYTVTATDSNGCTGEASVQVGQTGSTIQVTTTSTDAICSANNGTASASANGGSGNYSYEWDNGQIGATIQNLAPGVYTVTATDSNGCTGEATVQVGQTGSNIQVTTSSTPATCSANNGTASASANGGSGNYSYEWSNGQQGQTISNLASGVYTVTVTDSNGCTGEASVQVGLTGSTLQISVTATDATCGDDNGTATVSASGGNGSISYAWSNGSSTATITGLSGGNYTVTATDANGCSATATATVNADAELEIATSSTDITCFGDNDGTATVDFQGGSQPYTINWSNGANTNTITGLAAGQYGVTVTDGNGCVASSAVSISQPQPFNVNVTGTNANGGNNGSATANANGGTPPYFYLWNTQATTQTISNLTPAVYSVVVTDANGCTASGNIVIEDDTPPAGDYCESGAETTAYEWIQSVTVGNVNNPSGDNNGYADFTGLVVEMEQGGTAGVSLTPGFAGTTYNENWRIWIDFNQDGDFDDAGELVFAPAESNTTINGTINIPLTSSLGETQMRIAMKWGGIPTSCEFFTYGEVEDYTVNIIKDDTGGDCTNVIINSNDFESGWGIWKDGGSDCRRSINDAQYANSGDYCVRLRDNTNSSTMTTNSLNLSSFEEVTIDFSYITRSMDNANEDFWLQISTDGGQFFNTVEEWNRGDEFENGTREFDAVTMTGPFSANTVFRFRCDASGNSDWVFIDDVTISGCTNANPNFFDVSEPANFVNDETTNGVQNEIATQSVEGIQLAIYPNPVKDELTVDYQLSSTGNATLVIFDLTGKMVFQQSIENADTAKNQTTINVNQFNNGYYYLRIIGENDSQAVKFLKL